MKTFSTVIPTLLVAAVLTAPLGAQLTVTQEGVRDPSTLGETVTLDSTGIGQRVTSRLYLQFDPGIASSLTLRSVRVIGSPEFSYELSDVDRLPVSIRNELRLDLFVFYLPSSPGPAQATLELTLRMDGSSSVPSDTVYAVNLVGRVPAYALSYSLPGTGRVNVSPAGTVRFGHKPTGVTSEASLTLTNVGSGPGVVESFQISGTGAFAPVAPPTFPARLEPGASLNVQLGFRPASTFLYSGELTVGLAHTPALRYMLSGLGGDLFSFRVVSYASGSNAGSSERVQSGTPIVFGQSANSVQVVAENTRQSAVRVDAISVSGPFAISEGPHLPASVGPGGSISVLIEPSPAASGDLTGELVIGDAVFPLSINAPALPGVRYTSQGGSLRPGEQTALGLSLASPYPVDISGTLQLSLASPETSRDASLQWSSGGMSAAFEIPAGQTAAVFADDAQAIEFQAGLVSGEIVVSASFAALPWGIDVTPVLAPEVRYTVDVARLPEVQFSQAGGALDAGRDLALGLNLAAPYPDDIAGMLQLSFVASDLAGAATAWAGGRQVAFQIPAGGTTAMFGDNLATEFSAPPAEGELTVTARFALADAGADITPDPAPELVFSIQVIPMPEVSFSQSGGTVGAAEQIPMQVSIAETYPNDIGGILNLAFETRSFAIDPSVQWASGGRQAFFVILAGTREAVFAGQTTSNFFQTGTVAGEIVMTAQFFSVPNGYVNTSIERAATALAEITPDTRPEIRFDVLEQAPVLERVALGGTGQGGFSLQVTGFSTTRSVDSLSFSFTAASGAVLASDSLDVDVSGSFETYFSGNQSAASGGKFTATVGFNVDEGAFEDIQAVSVTATNLLGTSNSVSLDLN
ncbi:MAG: hypothetical protein F4Y47_06955 [Acidobacteriia bacterium]|nr:hypothetical protein [Terriglobia bacterium]MYG02612.1 hypothetical protein [Terriglobia bacterium]MYK10162.1 hypothetical protein [Terriglobia bacterium]